MIPPISEKIYLESGEICREYWSKFVRSTTPSLPPSGTWRITCFRTPSRRAQLGARVRRAGRVSVASVSRFVRKLGFGDSGSSARAGPRDHIDLRSSTRRSPRTTLITTSRARCSSEHPEHRGHAEAAAGRRPRRRGHGDQRRAATADVRARRIGLRGHDTAMRFSYLDFNARVLGQRADPAAPMRLRPKDVAIGISHSGGPWWRWKACGSRTRRALHHRIAQSRSPLKDEHLVLCTSFPEPGEDGGAVIAPRQLCVIDALYLLATRHREHSGTSPR